MSFTVRFRQKSGVDWILSPWVGGNLEGQQAAERFAFELVHSGQAGEAEVVIEQPVVAARVQRTMGREIRLSFPLEPA